MGSNDFYPRSGRSTGLPSTACIVAESNIWTGWSKKPTIRV